MKNPGIYILTSPNGKQYVGRDVNLPSRATQHFRGKNPKCRHVHRAIKKYGADAFDVEIIQYPGISHEALNAVERWKIRQLQTLAPKGCNLTEGGEGVIPSEETRQKFSESARIEQKKRLENGTHHFLGESNPVHKQITDGTHRFLNSEIQRQTQKKRLKDGTHNFLDSELQQRAEKKRVAVNKKRLEDGTHHLLGGEISRRTAQKRVKEGTHNFLGGEIQHRRVEDGTHHFLGGDIARRTAQKRLEDGTHHFLGDSNPAKQRSHKRRKAEWCYIIALSRYWYEIHDYTLKRRAEFLSKDIPDTSNAEQEYLF